MALSPQSTPVISAAFRKISSHVSSTAASAPRFPNTHVTRAAAPARSGGPNGEKLVWVWTESKQVMTAAVERGWDTFLFASGARALAQEWKSIALIQPLYIEGSGVYDEENTKVASLCDVSSPEQLEQLHPDDVQTDSLIISMEGEWQPLYIEGSGVYDEENTKVASLCDVSSPEQLEQLHPDDVQTDSLIISMEGEWQIIPAENIVAAFQGCQKTVFAIATTSDKAQIFLEALEQGLGGVVLKARDAEDVFKLKDYFDRRSEGQNLMELTTATITKVHIVGMGDRVCVDLCSLMRPGEGLLVGSFARGLFLVHSECLESNYISSRPFRVNAGPVHAYVAVPGGRTSYLSELNAGKEVIIVNESGLQRTAIVGRVKVESRQLILVEAKEDSERQTTYSIFLQNAETVGLVCPEDAHKRRVVPVTSLKIGDKVVIRVQRGARHTGVEINEFILEK